MEIACVAQTENNFEEHEHTKAARKTLYKLPIVGRMINGGDSSDDQKEGKTATKAVTSSGKGVDNLFDEQF